MLLKISLLLVQLVDSCDIFTLVPFDFMKTILAMLSGGSLVKSYFFGGLCLCGRGGVGFPLRNRWRGYVATVTPRYKGGRGGGSKYRQKVRYVTVE